MGTIRNFSNFQSVRFSNMRRILKLVALAWISGAIVLTGQAIADDLRVGYVNPGRVAEEAPQADAARRQLQDEFAPRDDSITQMQEALREMEDALAENRLVWDEARQQEVQRDIVVKRREIQRTQEAFRDDFNLRRNEALGALQRQILRVVGEFAEQEGFDLVVSDGVVFASDSINITDRIIDRLRRQYEQENPGE